MLNTVFRTIVYILVVDIIRSPLGMLLVGIGVGMYLEHCQPGTTATALQWAKLKLGGLAATTPFLPDL